MSPQIRISSRAEADLAQQYRWDMDNAGLAIAEGYLSAFDASTARLAEHPTLGRVRRFRAADLAGLRSSPVDAPFRVHLIFYRTSDQALEIVRVMHGARDLPRRLLE
jgi:toxin ParE1/3/4